MKSYLHRALALLLLCVPAFAQTTPNLGLNIPAAGSNVGTWGPVINSNFSTLDSLLGGTTPLSLFTAKNFEQVRYADQWCAAAGVLNQTCIANAIANLPSTGGVVVLPAATLNIASTITITAPVTIIGQGSSDNQGGGVNTPPYLPSTKLFWTGAGGGTMFSITPAGGQNAVGQVNLANFTVDGNSSAANAFTIERMWFSVWSNISINSFTGTGMVMTATGGVNNADTGVNSFYSIRMRTVGIGISMDGTLLNQDSFDNSFYDLQISYTGAEAINIISADNNTFFNTDLYKISGVGVGVNFQAPGGKLGAANNYFYHLQASTGGVSIASGTSGNAIFGYDLSNAEPFPTVPSGTQFYIQSLGGSGGAVSTGAQFYGNSVTNKVTLLNYQGTSGAITGTGADANIFTYTLPALTVPAGSAIRVKWGMSHSSGTASVTYKLALNNLVTNTISVATTGVGFGESIIQAASSTTLSGGATGGFGAFSTWYGAPNNTAGYAFGSNQALQLTFNVANTDQVTPIYFMVEMIQ